MFIIQDWAGNIMFHGKTFEDFEDADGFLSEELEKQIKEDGLNPEDDETFSEYRGEFYIAGKSEISCDCGELLTLKSEKAEGVCCNCQVATPWI